MRKDIYTTIIEMGQRFDLIFLTFFFKEIKVLFSVVNEIMGTKKHVTII